MQLQAVKETGARGRILSVTEAKPPEPNEPEFKQYPELAIFTHPGRDRHSPHHLHLCAEIAFYI